MCAGVLRARYARSLTPQANNVIIAQITPYGFQNIGYKYFIVYICTNLANIVICYLYFPETKNKSLEEIGLLFGDTNVRIPMILDPLGTKDPATVHEEGMDKGQGRPGMEDPAVGGAIC